MGISIRTSARAALLLVASTMIAAPAIADTQAGVRAWTAGDYDRAVEEWRLPAQNGDRDALFNMAQAYRLGRGVVLDLTKARDFYAAAAAKGHVRAADNYGLLLFGNGERERAIPLVRAASDRGDPRAQYVMGLAHFNGELVEKDWVRGYALVMLAQKAGLPQAVSAIQQMDQFISVEQRQAALSLSRAIEGGTNQPSSAQLTAPGANTPAVQTQPAPRAVLVAGTPSPIPPATSPASVAVATSTAATKALATPAPAPAKTLPAKTLEAPAVAAPVKTPRGDWALQLGAFGVKGNAERLWGKLESSAALSGTTRYLQEGRKLTVLYATGFESQSAASKACNSLKSQKQDCLVLKSPG